MNLDEKSESNHYNPFVYVKETMNFNDILGSDEKHQIQEDDVMSLINTLMANTKSENIENTSRRSVLGES